MDATASNTPIPIKIRAPKLPFTEGNIPRYWHNGSAVASHVFNGVNLLFPAGERFFVRSVKRYLDRFDDDPEMRKQIRGFFGQEGRHAREHERYFEILESQGYELDVFLDRFDKTLRFLEERMPPEYSLAATAAAEHFTAIMSELNFSEIQVFDDMHPIMRDLILWHSAEEIEHKAVAYDVFQKVDGRYWVRAAGMGIATVFLASAWLLGFITLMRKDGLTLDEIRADGIRFQEKRSAMGLSPRNILRDVFGAGIKEYLEGDFHPWNTPAPAEAMKYIAKLAEQG